LTAIESQTVTFPLNGPLQAAVESAGSSSAFTASGPDASIAAMRTKRFALVTLLLTLMAPRLGNAAPKDAGFTCTELIGVSVTGDWFGAGFEKLVDDARWQARSKHHAFIELWGDPKNPLWSDPIASPCAKNSSAPDRVVFTGVNWQYKTVDEWTAALTRAVDTIKARYPAVKRIELLTMLRGPGNKSCGNDQMTVVAPVVDEAVAKVVAAHPKLVTAGPKLEAPSCAVFTKGGPHYTPEGMQAVAKVYGAYYAKN
jgi:hypothetical protein